MALNSSKFFEVALFELSHLRAHCFVEMLFGRFGTEMESCKNILWKRYIHRIAYIFNLGRGSKSCKSLQLPF